MRTFLDAKSNASEPLTRRRIERPNFAEDCGVAAAPDTDATDERVDNI